MDMRGTRDCGVWRLMRLRFQCLRAPMWKTKTGLARMSSHSMSREMAAARERFMLLSSVVYSTTVHWWPEAPQVVGRPCIWLETMMFQMFLGLGFQRPDVHEHLIGQRVICQYGLRPGQIKGGHMRNRRSGSFPTERSKVYSSSGSR